MKDKHKSDEQKDKAITNKYKSLVQDKICAKAAALKSCCIHNRPLFMASHGCTEPLHMDLNIFEHWLIYIESKAVAATLNHCLCNETMVRNPSLKNAAKTPILSAYACTEGAIVKRKFKCNAGDLFNFWNQFEFQLSVAVYIILR